MTLKINEEFFESTALVILFPITVSGPANTRHFLFILSGTLCYIKH